MADYSEFPTTPTAWQEQALRELTASDTPASPTADPPARRRPDLTALVPGVVFVVIALAALGGAVIPLDVADGLLLCALLIGAGVALLVGEVRRTRRRRR